MSKNKNKVVNKATPIKEEKAPESVIEKEATKAAPAATPVEKAKPVIQKPASTESKAPKKAAIEKEIEKAADPMLNIGIIGTAGVTTASSMHPNQKVQLAVLMQERYVNNPELQKSNPELYNAMNGNVDTLVVLSLYDVQREVAERNANGEFTLLASPEAIIKLDEVAKTMGFNFKLQKALDSPKNKDGQSMLNFQEVMEMPVETKKDLDAEYAENVKPELDVTKISTPEDVAKGLAWMLRTDTKVTLGKALVNTINWYRAYKICSTTELEKKEEYRKALPGILVTEIFSIISPTVFLKGLGGSVYTYTSQFGTPIFAHAILHKYMKDSCTEEEIASILVAILNVKFHEKVLEDKTLKEYDEKALIALNNSKDIEWIDALMTAEKSDEKYRIKSCVIESYFKEQKDPDMYNKIRVQIGMLINLYRNPEDRLVEFTEGSGAKSPKAPKENKTEEATPATEAPAKTEEVPTAKEEPAKEEEPATEKKS